MPPRKARLVITDGPCKCPCHRQPATHQGKCCGSEGEQWLKTPDEWVKESDFTIFDAEGWRKEGVDFKERITYRRFHELAKQSVTRKKAN